MLRSMTFHNFIHFRDCTTLQFDQGFNLFIGGNCSGKSSVLELVRRCLSDKLSSSVSSSYDEENDAYIFCLYDVSDADKSDFDSASQLITAVVKTVRPKKWRKMVLLNKDKDIEVHSASYDIQEETQDTAREGKECISTIPKANSIFEILKEGKEMQGKIGKSKDIILKSIDKSLANDRLQSSQIKHFLGKLDEKYVTTMSMRSIGPLQWSRSDKIKPPEDNKEKNYIEASERAEILQELLDCQFVNKKQDRDLFNFLTHPIKYDFEKEGRKIKFTNPAFSKHYPLLKCPEGVVEARQLSLIMSDKRFRTICLEEPERGMHPQMVERMNIYLRSMKEEKTLIIVTHNPAFINTTKNAESTHLFYREHQEEQKENETDVVKIIKMVHRVTSCKDIVPYITDVDDIKKLLFASKILTVEGRTDKKVIEAIFENLLQKSDYEIDGIAVEKEEKHKIISHQIIQWSGSHSKTLSLIPIPKAYLVDRDQKIELEENKIIIKEISKDSELTKKWKGKPVEEFLQNDFKSYSEKLQKECFFIWKYGAMEETIRQALTKQDRLNEFFTVTQGIKKYLKNVERKNLLKLSGYLLDDEEIVRFIKFLLHHP